MRVVLVVAIGPLFLMPDPRWWILALFARYGTIVLDCVDGELARLRGSASPEGTFVDEFTGMACGRITTAFVALGLYFMLGEHVVVIALLGLTGMMLGLDHIHLLRAIALEWGLQRPARNSERPAESRGLRIARRAAMVLLVVPGGLQYLPHLLLASLLDLVVSPFTLFGFAFNVRLLWFTGFGLGLALAGVVRAYLTVRGGVSRLL